LPTKLHVLKTTQGKAPHNNTRKMHTNPHHIQNITPTKQKQKEQTHQRETAALEAKSNKGL
jgi:hypothetical protein